MNVFKSTIVSTITLGVCSLAMPARADTFNPAFPVVTEIHGVAGANTSSSFAASSLMGEHGFSNSYLGVVTSTVPGGWESTITSRCTAQTPAASKWPSRCNPDGMALSLNISTHTTWVVSKFDGTAQTAALNNIVAGLQQFRSPVVVPIFGQADHWVVIKQINATILAPGSYSILNLNFYEGGPTGGLDSSGNTYNGGSQSFGGNTWKNVYFLVVTAINPTCDIVPGGCGAPPVSDPFYNKYVTMIEPPDVAVNHLDLAFDKSPGLVPPGHMNEHLAQARLWDALISAGIHKNPEIWDVISKGVSGPASLVNGVFPDGSPWNYYLVPILSNANTVIGFAELDADDGSFNHVWALSTPLPFTPVTKGRAAQLAGGVLGRGETLTESKLTWDPRSDAQLARSPSFPYYEFGVRDATGKTSTARVRLHDGKAVRGR